MNVPFDKIYIINYCESTERKECILNNLLNDLHIPEDKIELRIVDTLPNSLYKYSKQIVNDNFYDEREVVTNDKYIFNKVLSCSLNHYWCISTAYKLNYNSILILEDDAYFYNNELTEYTFNNLPKNYKICKFTLQPECCFGKDYSYITEHFFEKNDKIQEFSNYPFLGKNGSATAYCLDRNGMELMINLYNNNEKIAAPDAMMANLLEYIYFTKYQIGFWSKYCHSTIDNKDYKH